MVAKVCVYKVVKFLFVHAKNNVKGKMTQYPGVPHKASIRPFHSINHADIIPWFLYAIAFDSSGGGGPPVVGRPMKILK